MRMELGLEKRASQPSLTQTFPAQSRQAQFTTFTITTVATTRLVGKVMEGEHILCYSTNSTP